jgi:hypothetical protein
MQNEVADLMDELVTPNQIELHTPHTNPSFPLINELLSFKYVGLAFRLTYILGWAMGIEPTRAITLGGF